MLAISGVTDIDVENQDFHLSRDDPQKLSKGTGIIPLIVDDFVVVVNSTD